MLRTCGDTLDHAGSGPDPRACVSLDDCLAELDAARRAVALETLAELRSGIGVAEGESVRGEFERPLYAAHELGYVVALSGHTVAFIAAADSVPGGPD